jgi:hypothetical protein
MNHQTKISERNGSPEKASQALARNAGEFAHHVLILAELQAELFVADVQESGRRVRVPGLVLLCGVALGLACFPIALTALALSLKQVLETSYTAGFLMAFGVGAVLSAVLCVVGWFQVRASVTVLRRSQQELVRNLHWIMKVLERSRVGRSDSTDNCWRTVT